MKEGWWADAGESIDYPRANSLVANYGANKLEL